MTKYYKVLDENGRSCNGGGYQYDLPTKNADGTWTPGKWTTPVKGDLELCDNGYHLCDGKHLIEWLGAAIYEAEYKGQMELYLRWLDKYDRAPGEESPIGLILCAGANAEQVELMDLSSANIRVAEYLDHMPDMKVMQAQLHRAAELARERAARGRLPHVAETKAEQE